MYKATPAKPDQTFNEKYIYLCQTLGCGWQISTFPTAEKNPAPVHCKDCQNLATRKEVEAEYARLNA
jgi:hypothetical protein